MSPLSSSSGQYYAAYGASGAAPPPLPKPPVIPRYDLLHPLSGVALVDRVDLPDDLRLRLVVLGYVGAGRKPPRRRYDHASAIVGFDSSSSCRRDDQLRLERW